jgi:hypothetical protein
VEWRESASPNTSGESSETKLALTDAGAGAVAEEGVEETGAEAGAGASPLPFSISHFSVFDFVWLIIIFVSLTIYIFSCVVSFIV